LSKSEKNSGSGSSGAGAGSPPTPTMEKLSEVAYVAPGMEMNTRSGLLFGGAEVRPRDFNGGMKVFKYYLQPNIGCLLKEKPKGK